ncbi:hypothetical protein with a putative beta-lactamase/transpeptidase-like domain [Bradyrhizobium sp. ORS 278]|nr:hypothetical protein with a putative beta-lactamase/transpeptidase-like domain [Bradyrhizobium sp. ORS 278]
MPFVVAPALPAALSSHCSPWDIASRWIDAFAAQKLFGPLGITDVEWLSFPGNTEPAAFAGLRLRPRDLAKLGQLMLADGSWDGSQVVPARWVAGSSAADEYRGARGALLRLSLVA